MDDKCEIKEKIKEIRHLFSVYRNGIVSENLKNAGFPYKLIYGLQVPDLTRIAKDFNIDKQLAIDLWKEKDIRECRLLACWLFPRDLQSEEIIDLIEDLKTYEEAEILNFRFLRFLPSPKLILDYYNSHPAQNIYSDHALNLLKKSLEIS